MSEPTVNGIDVSECEFLECGMCNAQRNCDGYTGVECKYDNENCYYRQLKRLEQQIQTYQLSENEAKEIIAELKHKLKRLQKENEKSLK